MNMTTNKFLLLMTWAIATLGLQSCLDSDDNLSENLPNAVVTVKKSPSGDTYLQLDEATTLFPDNISHPLFEGKEVRALINFATLDKSTPGYTKTVRLNWIDSIRTKDITCVTPATDLAPFGKDPLEIVNDWVTVCEDGYLTLRIRTLRASTTKPHYIWLISGTNPENPLEVELLHDASGDTNGRFADGLITFRLDALEPYIREDSRLVVKWRSYDGRTKRATFKLRGKEEGPLAAK